MNQQTNSPNMDEATYLPEMDQQRADWPNMEQRAYLSNPNYSIEEAFEEPVYWENIKSRSRYPTPGERGSFHLYVYPEERTQIWDLICFLTSEDKLGYMSSISPDVMNGGEHSGAYTVSVHTDYNDLAKEAIAHANLLEAGLGSRIFTYRFIKKFRNFTD